MQNCFCFDREVLRKAFFLNTYEQITSEPNYVEMQKNEQKKADDVNSKINTQ